MENSVNTRVLMLKTELRLTDIQFCGRANISTFTLNKIKNNEEVTIKVINSIIQSLNVNKDWLLTGKGKMFNEPLPGAASLLAGAKSDFNPYKDALVAELKGQVVYLQEMLKLALGNKNANFLKAIEEAAAPLSLISNLKGTASVAKA